MFIPSWLDASKTVACPTCGPGTMQTIVTGRRTAYRRDRTPFESTTTGYQCQARETADPRSRWCRWMPSVEQEIDAEQAA